MTIKFSKLLLTTTLIWCSISSFAQETPPDTWQEHWYEHDQLVNLFYYDDDVIIYYDDDMDTSITWMNSYVGDAWRYTKKRYGNMTGGGSDERLWAIFHQDKYGGGHPAYYYNDDHDNRNAIDLAQDGSWYEPTGWALDATIHEIGHIVESTTNNSQGSPAFPIWGDSKWCVIYQYDVYVVLDWTSEAERWYEEKSTDPWFTDWFYPIWRDYGNGEVLSRFFQILAQNFPKNGKAYTRDMNTGEFVHFWSEATHTNLKEMATSIFDWTDDIEAQFVQAQEQFPLSYHNTNVSRTDITDNGGTITTQYTDSPSGEGVENLIDNSTSTKFLTFNSGAWIQFEADQGYSIDGYSLSSANDSEERDPLNWTLAGSNDGTQWDTLDTRSDEDFPYRYQKRFFDIDNATSYAYYRFAFNNNSGSILQLSEIELFKKEESNNSFTLRTEAEDYSSMLGVENETTADPDGGDLNVGYIDDTDWMAYPAITIPSSGYYTISYRVASLNGGGILSLDVNAGSNVLGTIDVPSTGAWQTWTTISHTVYIEAGTYDFGIYASTGGWNINWWTIESASSNDAARQWNNDDASETLNEDLTIYPIPAQSVIHIAGTEAGEKIYIYDLSGKMLVKHKANADKNTTDIDINNFNSGVYVIKTKSKTYRFIKQ